MVEKVTAGATGAMGNITGMSTFDASYLTGMMEKVTSGATGALGHITMDDYDATDLSGMMEKVTSGATGALGNISMDGYSSDNLSGMVTKITSGATGALGDISMDGYSSDNISAMTTSISTSVTNAVSDIAMLNTDGTTYNPSTDNFTSSITSGASSGTVFMLGSDNVSGIFYISYNGETPSNGCINNSALLSSYSTAYQVPTSANSMIVKSFLTSSTSGSRKTSYYSDISCATLLGSHQTNYKNITKGTRISTTAGTDGRPTSAYQVSYEYKDIITKAVTTDAATLTLLNSKNGYSGSAHVANVPQTTKLYGIVKDIWAIATDSGGTTWFYMGTASDMNYPTDWTVYDDIMFK
jgi:hypothetical protein